MSQDHHLQQQRFELKYLVPESLTGALRDFLKCHLELDDFGVGRPNNSYPIHSLYLDSDDLQTHHATQNGEKNRFKIRLRYYNDLPEAPVFVEIKSRVDSCILKHRCPVRRAAVPLLLAGHLPDPEQILSPEPRHHGALQQFNRLLLHLDARPKAHNAYLREAWVSPENNSVRVTFDRDILIEPFFNGETVMTMKNPTRVYPEFVVMEIKFTNRFPNWLRELVQWFGLRQFSAAKYSTGVALLGEHRFQTRGRNVWSAVSTAALAHEIL